MPGTLQTNSSDARLLRGTILAAAYGALAVILGVAIIVYFLPFGSVFAAASLSVYTAAASIMAARVESFHPHAQFGLANAVTLVRLVGVSLFAGLALELALGADIGDGILWSFAALAIVIVALDGADGYLARRQGLQSEFGARFDHEVDTFLLLLLSILALQLGKAGPWVLLIGAMRYLFVATSWLWPVLRAPLPPSFRRSAICVVQGVVLLLLLMPAVTPPTSFSLAALALALLSYSFAVDVVGLVRGRGVR